MEIRNLYNQYLQALIKIYTEGEATAITHLVFKEKGYFTKGRLPDKNIDLAREETDDLLGILDKLKKHLYLHPQSTSSNALNCKGTLAQMVEQWTENPCVPGSIPGGTTKPE